MSTLLIFTISAFVTFFTIIDPVGLAPIFVGFTSHLSKEQREAVVTRAIVISAGITIFFALVGRFLLDRLGIQLYAFTVAGGILLFLVAVDMLFGRLSGTRETKAEEEEAMTREDISVFPLAIPLMAGPGTIAATILYVDIAARNPLELVLLAGAIALTPCVAWLTMRSSTWIVQRMGRTGTLVFSRILGILLTALALQFILNGIATFLRTSSIH